MKSRTGMWALVIIVILLIIVGLLIFAAAGPSSLPPTTTQTATTTSQIIEATFTCDAGKTIEATFMNETTSTTTGNSVQLALSDGRQMTLLQVISADGARYANADQSFVFWNVGNGATIWENNAITYDNCVSQNSQ